MEDNNSTPSKKLPFRKRKEINDENKKAKSWLREWIDALVFAFIAAAILRAFLFGSYKIPTPSMEKSLMVGDFLIVSNITYGPRTPMAVCIPFTELCLPGVKLPSFRIPGYRNIKRNDIIVFNVPFEVKPISQKTNYVKRAVGVAGDTLAMRNKILYVNGEPEESHEDLQRHYLLRMKNKVRLSETKLKAVGAGKLFGEAYSEYLGEDTYRVNLSEQAASELRSWQEVDSLWMYSLSEDDVAMGYVQSAGSFSRAFKNPDNFDSFVVPYKGMVLELNDENWFIYKDVIERYENNKLERRDGAVFINGVQTDVYEVKADYYFGMGDNRDNSEDSRFWGFIPKNHIIGNAVIVWYSHDRGIPRFKRIFKLIR